MEGLNEKKILPEARVREKKISSDKSIVRRFQKYGIIFIVLAIVTIGGVFGYSTRINAYEDMSNLLNTKVNTFTSVSVSIVSEDDEDVIGELITLSNQLVANENVYYELLDIDNQIKYDNGAAISFSQDDIADLDVVNNQYTGKFQNTYVENNISFMEVFSTHYIDGVGWFGIRFTTDLTEVNSTILRSVLMVVAIIAFVSIGIIAVTIFLLKSVIVPIKAVSVSASKIASGDFSVRVVKDRNDEVGKLCDSVNKMAEELSKIEQLKNEFISSVSHELRTPLTAIKGWGETIISLDIENETAEKGLTIISNEVTRLSEMVEELLDFSRITQNRFTLNLDVIDIVAEVSEGVMMYRERAASENKKLTFYEPQTPVMVYADRNRMLQVINNILDNALKFTEEGGLVDVSLNFDEEIVMLTIADNGCGIPESELFKVKDMFYKTSKNNLRGTGIGLAIADEIILMHGGEMQIQSEVSRGTKVIISLPHYKEEEYIES